MLGFRSGRLKIVAVLLAIVLVSGSGPFARALLHGYDERDEYEEEEEDGKNCIAPNGDRGLCRNLNNCKHLLQLLIENRSNADSRVVQLLKRSHCGFDGFDPIVCCPLDKTKPKKNEGRIHSYQPPSNTDNDETCGFIQEENKIVGGTTTALKEFPWMALIGYKTRHGVQYRCGGSLVSSRYILTAAHCVSSLTDISPISVRLGEYNLGTRIDCAKSSGCSPPAIDIPIEKIIPHPDYYKPELRNDIALIKLAKKVQMRDSIRPICLPINVRTLSSTKAIVTGWGTTESGIKSQVLLKATLPIVSKSECAQIYKRKVPIVSSQICAGGEAGKDSCSGDSGGPLQVIGLNSAGQPAYIQHGVVSFGPRYCGTDKMPGVYTRVSHYTDWILENMNE